MVVARVLSALKTPSTEPLSPSHKSLSHGKRATMLAGLQMPTFQRRPSLTAQRLVNVSDLFQLNMAGGLTDERDDQPTPQ